MKTHHTKTWGWHPKVRKGDQLTLGERWADRMKAVLATWPALIGMILYIAIWILINSHFVRGHHFDPMPFILLNLTLSTLAGLQCFVLLIANKRGEQIAAETAQHTLELTTEIDNLIKENTTLTKQVHNNTIQVEEIHKHVTALCIKMKVSAGDYEPKV